MHLKDCLLAAKSINGAYDTCLLMHATMTINNLEKLKYNFHNQSTLKKGLLYPNRSLDLKYPELMYRRQSYLFESCRLI